MRRHHLLLLALALGAALLLPALAQARTTPPPVPACFSEAGICQSVPIKAPIGFAKLTAAKDGIFKLTGPGPLQTKMSVACGDLGCIYNHLDWHVGIDGAVKSGCETNTTKCAVAVGAGAEVWEPVVVTQNDFPVAAFLLWRAPGAHTISGKVEIADCATGHCISKPFAGAIVKAKGPHGSGSGISGSDGRYEIGVPHGRRYVVTPSYPHSKFSPDDRTVDVSGDVGGVDFHVLSPCDEAGRRQAGAGENCPSTISGTLAAPCIGKRCHPIPLPGVTVVLRDSNGMAVDGDVTDAKGDYTFTKVAKGAYTVTPSILAGASSAPAFRGVTVPPKSVNADFLVCTLTPPEGADCGPRFAYTMADRFDLTGDIDGVEPSAYQPDHYDVDLKVKGGECDATAGYSWLVGTFPVLGSMDGCVYHARFAKTGIYKVTNTQSGGTTGVTTSTTKAVDVKDLVVVGVGDSLASGEGNGPFTSSKIGGCDRSRAAYGRQAARRLEDADDQSSVTWVFAACSGATISSDKEEKNLRAEPIRTQLAEVKKLLGGRRIDALVMSIGINDAGFSTIAGYCAALERCFEHKVADPDGGDDITLKQYARSRVRNLSSRYSRLNRLIEEYFPKAPRHIYLVGYPNPFHEAPGKLCETVLGSAVLGITDADGQHEVTDSQNELLEPIIYSQRVDAHDHGWEYVDVPTSTFASHGTCARDSWFVGIARGAGRLNPSGILHPNAAGQDAIAQLLFKRLKTDLLSDDD